MGRDLALAEAAEGAIPVCLAPAPEDKAPVAEDKAPAAEDEAPAAKDEEQEASGLAMMLHQFLEQTLEESPRKRLLARRLRGEAIFRAAEDEAIRVRIRFRGDRIELGDVAEAEPEGSPAITADFLSIAHLTSGRESPLALLLRRKLRARFRPGDVPFLLRMLAFMRIANTETERSRLVYVLLGGAVLLGVIYVLV